MSKIHRQFASKISGFIFVFSFLLTCSMISYGQTWLSGDKFLSDSSKKLSEETTKPAPERPRLVAKSGSDENKTAKTENADKTNVEKSASKPAANAALISQLEHKAFDILNQRRTENGLEPIKWNEEMARIARMHSEDMAEYNYFSHAGRNGAMVSDRADLVGISDWRAIGENIAFNRGVEKPADFACESWMKSPPHHANIMNKQWKEAGIGISIAKDGSYYFTEVFILR